MRSGASTETEAPLPPRNEAAVLLLSLPWLEPRQAPLGLTVVSSLLTEAGLPCVTRYGNVGFFSRLCSSFGDVTARAVYSHGDVGELVGGAVMRRLEGSYAAVEDVTAVLSEQQFPPALFEHLVTELWNYAQQDVEEIAALKPEVVGFTLTIAQTAASLLWARLLKRMSPTTSVVIGGSQCEDPMGLALIRGCHDIDVVARGEADDVVVPLFRAVLEGDPLGVVPGIAFRDGDNVVATPKVARRAPGRTRLDYRGFAEAYEPLRRRTSQSANYYVEGSRGCWWGESRQCTFCGIHTSGIAYQAKSPDDVLSEIEHVLAQTKSFRIVLSDTILGHEHLVMLLPRLEEMAARYDVEFLADVKNSLRKEQVYQLARAGFITLQIGIESLSTRLLALMRKGNTALQHVQALKWCAEAGIGPYYQLLTHVPGERVDDYDDSFRLASRIQHLPPPAGVFPIEINRYAPYFEQWKEFGFNPPVPSRHYAHILPPGNCVNLADFAYAFEGRHPSTESAELDAVRQRLTEFVSEKWRPGYDNHLLSHRVGDGYVEVNLESPRGRDITFLEGAAAIAFLELDRVRGISYLLRVLDGRMTEAQLVGQLREWADADLVACDRDRWLALSVRQQRLRPTPPASVSLGPAQLPLIVKTAGGR